MPHDALIDHLRLHSLRTDGPFTLRSGERSSWYVDARNTTFDGAGAWLVGEAVLARVQPDVGAVGGMTMGADPIAVATAMVAHDKGRDLRSFSIRKTEKEHGAGGRLVGALRSGERVAVLEDTTTTGSAAAEAVEVLVAAGAVVVQVIALVDRSDGTAKSRFEALQIPFTAIVSPSELGVTD